MHFSRSGFRGCQREYFLFLNFCIFILEKPVDKECEDRCNKAGYLGGN